jgi:tripartite-type tricarboxylate transporter receptor subunit TctC
MTMIKILGALCSALALLVSPAIAQQPVPLPSLIKIVVPVAAGASADSMARSVASDLAQRVGSTVIVENMPGASTFIGSAAVARGPKDGSVLLLTSVSTFTAAATKSNLPQQIKAGRLRLVGVTTPQPHPSFPGVPTMASVAPGFAIDNWILRSSRHTSSRASATQSRTHRERQEQGRASGDRPRRLRSYGAFAGGIRRARAQQLYRIQEAGGGEEHRG